MCAAAHRWTARGAWAWLGAMRPLRLHPAPYMEGHGTRMLHNPRMLGRHPACPPARPRVLPATADLRPDRHLREEGPQARQGHAGVGGDGGRVHGGAEHVAHGHRAGPRGLLDQLAGAQAGLAGGRRAHCTGHDGSSLHEGPAALAAAQQGGGAGRARHALLLSCGSSARALNGVAPQPALHVAAYAPACFPSSAMPFLPTP